MGCCQGRNKVHKTRNGSLQPSWGNPYCLHPSLGIYANNNAKGSWADWRLEKCAGYETADKVRFFLLMSRFYKEMYFFPMNWCWKGNWRTQQHYQEQRGVKVRRNKGTPLKSLRVLYRIELMTLPRLTSVCARLRPANLLKRAKKLYSSNFDGGMGPLSWYCNYYKPEELIGRKLFLFRTSSLQSFAVLKAAWFFCSSRRWFKGFFCWQYACRLKILIYLVCRQPASREGYRPRSPLS